MSTTFTEKVLLKLPLPPASAGPKDHADSAVAGLVLTIRSTGTRTWFYRYRHGEGADRKQRRYCLGSWPDVTLQTAREKALAAQKLVRKGIDPAEHDELRRKEAEKLKAANGRSFPAMAEKFIQYQRNRERRSWARQAQLLGFTVAADDDGNPALAMTETGLAQRWADRSLSSIERLDVTEAVSELTNSGRPEAARTRLNLLKTLMRWAEADGYIDRSPIDGKKYDKPKPSRERVLSDGEIRRLWRATDAVDYPTQQFVRLLLLTGARRNEVAGMRLSEISGDVWTIPAERSKNKLAHKLPLSELAQDVIQSALKHTSGVVLTSNGLRPVTGFSVMKATVDRHVAKTKGESIQPWTFHDLRRTVATGMAAIGILPHTVELVLNHVSVLRGVAKTYNRYDYLPEKREALERWAERLAEIVSEKID